MCIRHQETAPLGIIEDVLDTHGVRWQYHDCWAEPGPPKLKDVSGLIVLGGAMNVDEVETYPYLVGIRDLVRDAFHTEVPVLGICLGAQILARALGGEVYPAPRRELGFVEVESSGVADELLEPFAPAAKIFQFHEDTCSLPPRSELLFTGKNAAVQAFRAGKRAYGVQFHFEVTLREVEAWCDEVVDLKTEWGASKEEVMAQVRAELHGQQVAGREVARRFVGLLEQQ